MHPGDVERLERCGQPPQVRVHPGAYVVHVRGDVLQTSGNVQPPGQVVRTPARRQLRVESVGEHRRIMRLFGELDRLQGERRAAYRVVAVDPRAGQRSGEPCPRGGGVGGGEVCLVQQSGSPAAGAAEALQRREPERRGGHGVDIVSGTRRDEGVAVRGACRLPCRVVLDRPHAYSIGVGTAPLPG